MPAPGQNQTKAIKENIARARAYFGKGEDLKSLYALCESLGALIKGQVFGREKVEVGILIDEVLRGLNQREEIRTMIKAPLEYKRGQEKRLFLVLGRLHDAIKENRERVAREERRGEMMQLDDLILEGQKFLDAKQPVEARKFFRRATERYPEIRGLNVDVGQRLLKAGLFQECIEYFEKSIELDPSDSRPYTFLVMAYEALQDMDKAEEMVMNVLKRFGANESVYMRLARIHLQKRNWNEAYDAAQKVLEINPLHAEAKKIVSRVGPRIFGKSHTG